MPTSTPTLLRSCRIRTSIRVRRHDLCNDRMSDQTRINTPEVTTRTTPAPGTRHPYPYPNNKWSRMPADIKCRLWSGRQQPRPKLACNITTLPLYFPRAITEPNRTDVFMCCAHTYTSSKGNVTEWVDCGSPCCPTSEAAQQ